MTAPIGYPEKFGVLLNSRELGPKPEVEQTGELGQKIAPEKILGPTFSEQLGEFVSSIDQSQKVAHIQSEKFAVGRSNDIHNTMIEVQQAEITLHLLANVRNRMVDIYREVMRMGS